MSINNVTCSDCKLHKCNNLNEYNDSFPDGCPSNDAMCTAIIKEYQNEDELRIARAAFLVVNEGYGKQNRLEEIISFAKKAEYKTLGIAFCIGLAKEAAVIADILKDHNFIVESIICKSGALSHEVIGFASIRPMCNPIGQAILLNELSTEFNIVVGLCIGHDSLFIKHSKAPVTVFAVKDRVLNHNPLEAVYTAFKNDDS